MKFLAIFKLKPGPTWPSTEGEFGMAIDYAALKTEIQNDPAGLGYAPFVAEGADNAIAGLLNAIITGNKVNTGSLTSDKLKQCITQADYAGLTTAQRSWLDFISQAPNIDLNNTTVAGGLNTLFPSGTSRNNVIAAQQRDGSRAEKLFGAGTFITDLDVAKALRG